MPHRHLCACLAALTLVACGDIGTGPPKPAVILALNNPVSAQVGESVQLSVRITDEEGLAIEGVVVSWTAPSEVNVDPKESVTDLEGIASASLSLPRAPTTFVVSALAEGLPPAEFNVKWGARELAVIKQFQKAARGESANPPWSDDYQPWPATDPYRLTGMEPELVEGGFTTAAGREVTLARLRQVIDRGQFVDIFFHRIEPEQAAGFRMLVEMLAAHKDQMRVYHQLFPD